jgi:hypothetical protein
VVMTIVAIKGKGAFIGSQCKTGYNVSRRYQRGDEPCDTQDVFEWVGSFKTQSSASKFIKTNKFNDRLEIIEYKKPKTT